MTQFCTLASGSSGNCSFVRTDGESFLIDAGISCRAIVNGLKTADALPQEIDGIFITHEHSDHVKGLKVFLKKYRVPVYASPEVLEYLAANDLVPPDAILFEMTKSTKLHFSAGISCFDTPHDSVHSMGYRIDTKDASIGIATDLGYMTDSVRKSLNGCKIVLIESNYDKNMLACGSYPYYLKRRIMGEKGHLCNDECAGELYGLVENGAKHILLGHISRENNLPYLAHSTAIEELSKYGVRENVDCTVCAAPRYERSEIYGF